MCNRRLDPLTRRRLRRSLRPVHMYGRRGLVKATSSREALEAIIDDANAEPDPVLSNLKITLAQRELSHRLRRDHGRRRRRQLPFLGRVGLQEGGGHRAPGGPRRRPPGCQRRGGDRRERRGSGLRLPADPAGAPGARWCGLARAAAPRCPRWARSAVPSSAAPSHAGPEPEASRLVLEGNRLVLDDIGRQTARFCGAFETGAPIRGEALDALLAGMAPRGHQNEAARICFRSPSPATLERPIPRTCTRSTRPRTTPTAWRS